MRTFIENTIQNTISFCDSIITGFNCDENCDAVNGNLKCLNIG